ncbi:MAG: T9SS type A sorting domain-containing protein [Bacteroidota bacterium]
MKKLLLFTTLLFLILFINAQTTTKGIFSISLSSTDVLCYGNCDGSITINITGTPTYPVDIRLNIPAELGGGFTDYNGLLAVDFPYTINALCGAVSIYTVEVTDFDSDIQTDNIIVVEPLAISVNAGFNQNICENEQVILNGSVTTATGGIWSTSGSGTFNPSNTDLYANYILSATDIMSGSIILTLISTGNGTCNSASDNVIITIFAAPIVSAGPDTTICSGNSYLLPGTMGGSAMFINWTSSGTGTFSNSTLLTPNYNPSLNDITNGSVILTISSNDPTGPCFATSDSMTLYISEPAANLITTNATGNGYCNGSILANVSGGTPPYTFIWDNGTTDSLLSNLCGGIYYLTITDNINCNISLFDTITNPLDSLSFSDTLSTTVDTCIFNNSLPVDSAWITNATIIGNDILFTWIFWQEGTSITHSFLYPYSGVYSGNGLVYLTIICTSGSKTIYAFNFIDFYDLSILIGNGQLAINNFKIYPNPTTGVITINNEKLEIKNVSVFDIYGKEIFIDKVKSQKSNNKSQKYELDLSSLPKGIYLIKLTTVEGVMVEKVIKS